jgi:type IV pilus assembly protein PilN
MIRINLLAVERERTRRRAGFQIAQKLTLACSLILLATALGTGWWYWSLRQQSIRLDEEIAAAEQETQRLRSVIQQVQQFEGRKAQLQQRVTLIEQLRRGQSAPVHMLDQLSRSLPERLWLSELAQKDQEITIGGRTTSLTALSDFVGNLEASGYFLRPVEIISSQVETQQQGEVVRFSVKALFQPPAP